MPTLTQVLTIRSLLAKYPIRNKAWKYHPESNSFLVFENDLNNNLKDPWNRPLPHTNGEGELTHETILTTVAGREIELTIWND